MINSASRNTLAGLLTATVLLVAGCVSAPNAIRFESATHLPLQQAVQQPEAHKGTSVRWGGLVARVENRPEDTLVEIVGQPLDSMGRPETTDSTGGRFIALVPGFLDPVIYEPGREITVVGALGDAIAGKIGDHNYKFPVVISSGYHLWQERPDYYYVGVPYSHWDPFWYPYYSRWNYWPYYRSPFIYGGYYYRRGHRHRHYYPKDGVDSGSSSSGPRMTPAPQTRERKNRANPASRQVQELRNKKKN